ncbi:hypothetical protein VNO78_09296 [Psophocarpus tetragonolobus]|uniref:Uncharacterized protein n=1 Tax=Psophocarpus tetragonolobus TaxID=3891 RepID=A0AAN9T6G8_PSOTE
MQVGVEVAHVQQEPSLVVQDENMAWAHMQHHVENDQMTITEGSTMYMDNMVIEDEGLVEVLVECIE